MSEAIAHAPLAEDARRWIGRPAPRKEDERFLKGRGRYVDDITLPGQLHAAFVRSPHAHAQILRIDLTAANNAPQVVACFDGADIDDLVDVPPNWVLPGSNAKGRPPLARKIVRHFGEAVAVVIAETRRAAVDAAERVAVDYQPLPVMIDQEDAAASGAPLVHPDVLGNLATQMPAGAPGFDEAAEKADLVITMRLKNQRLVPFSIEPRAVNAAFEPTTGRMVFYSSNQVPHVLRRMLASALGFPENKLQVISPDVGGGFGPKMHFYPEELLLAWATRRLGRPVKWTETRSENVSATTHGRDHAMVAEIAANRDGEILGMRVKSLANIGAYASSMGTGVPTVNVGLFMNGVYAIPTSEVLIQCFYTHTTPVDAYRGAGRPEAAYLIERVVDRVAQEAGVDPAEVRFRNFVPPEKMPYRQGLGTTLDSGDYEKTLKLALDCVDYAALRKQQKKARAEGRLIGIGISNYTETCAIGDSVLLGLVGFDRGGFESAKVRVQPDGSVVAYSGSHSQGQGHATTFAQIAADALGFDPADIEIVQGDTEQAPFGIGTFNSRSVPVGGTAIKIAADRVAARMRLIAGHLLQADPDAVRCVGGVFRVEGSGGSVTAREVAAAAWTGHTIPRDIGIGLEETEFYHPTAMSSPPWRAYRPAGD